MKNLFVRLAGVGILGIATPAVATHFIVCVYPSTGASSIFLSAGALSPRGETPSPTGPIVHPSQQAPLAPGPMALDPETTAALLAQSVADSPVIQALLANRSAIDAENQQLLDNLAATLDRQLTGGLDPDQLDRVQQNLDSLVRNILQQGLGQDDLSEDELNAIIEQVTSRDITRERSSLAEQQRQQREQMFLEQQKQSQRQQAEQLRDRQQAQQELIPKIQEQQRQLEEANRQAQEAAKRRAEENLAQSLDDTERERLTQQQQLRNRMLARGETSPELNPSAPVTPESYRSHLSGVSGPSRTPETNSPSTQAGDTGSNESDPDSSSLASAPPVGATLGDVHTDYASEEQRNRAVEGAADDYLASEPEPEPGVDLEQLWLSFLANNDGPYTEELPTESIYGEAVGIYN